MTSKMRLFCENYLDTRNGAKSYAKAYGKDIESEEGRKKNYNSVTTNASKLLKDPRIKKYLESRMLEMDYERELTEKEIEMQLTKMALGGQYKENTRLEALKMLSRIKGMYEEDKTEQSISINLSSDLQKQIEENRKPNPRILDVNEVEEVE